ncbi:MAG: phosphoribosylglycinamide formyltransferase [Candidatus Heimdallarchaeaceae archaeon]
MNIAVLISGRGSNLKAILDAEKKKKITKAKVKLIISSNSKAEGLKYAKTYQKESICLDPEKFNTNNEYDAELAKIIKNYNIELIVLAGFMRILSPSFVKLFRNRIINIHPSLLPSFPGLKAQKQALDHGVKITGCTVHFVTEIVDKGPIIVQKAVEIQDDDTEVSLSKRILEKEHEILPLAIKLISEGRVSLVNNKVRIV